MDNISSVAFGLEVNSFKDPNSPVRVQAKKFLSPGSIYSLTVMFATSFPSLGHFLGIRAVLKEVSDFFTKLVVDTISYREKTNTVRKDFLQLLIDTKNNKDKQENGNKDNENTLTMDEIVAQSFVFFLGGFETSSATMSFALFELALQPEIQEKLRNEMNTVLAQHGNQVTYDSLSEMKYLGQVIDETLRKYPPLAFITRVAHEDYKLPGEDVVLEKGTQVVIPIQAYHYDEEYFSNPNVFDPDRFSEKNKFGRHPYTYLPFGGGPRTCIGNYNEKYIRCFQKVWFNLLIENGCVSLILKQLAAYTPVKKPQQMTQPPEKSESFETSHTYLEVPKNEYTESPHEYEASASGN